MWKKRLPEDLAWQKFLQPRARPPGAQVPGGGCVFWVFGAFWVMQPVAFSSPAASGECTEPRRQSRPASPRSSPFPEPIVLFQPVQPVQQTRDAHASCSHVSRLLRHTRLRWRKMEGCFGAEERGPPSCAAVSRPHLCVQSFLIFPD